MLVSEAQLTGDTILIQLVEAKDRLERLGWTKHIVCNGNNQRCILGAFDGDRFDWERTGADQQRAVEYLWNEGIRAVTKPDSVFSVTGFNDSKNTSLTEVYAAFDSAILHRRIYLASRALEASMASQEVVS